jgi:hypothetical protein
MPIAPALPFGGLTGLRFLDRTYDQQFATFNRSPDVQRELTYFLETAGEITTVDQLMGDRRILSVVLGAFGLDEDIDKGAFIRKVIEEGTIENDAFANRLIEPAYREMSAFLGFGDIGGTLIFESTRLNLVDRYGERQFELAVGEQDLDLRLAMNFRREAAEIAAGATTDRTKWFQLLATPPVRSVVEGALLLPQEFGLIDIDQQVEEVASRMEQFFDITSPDQLLEDGNIDKMIDRFLLNSQVINGVTSSDVRGATALSLLQSSSLGAFGTSNLFASNFI